MVSKAQITSAVVIVGVMVLYKMFAPRVGLPTL